MKVEFNEGQRSMVRHYLDQAKGVLATMEFASCEQARAQMFKTALNYMLMAMKEIEDKVAGPTRLELWAAMAAAGCIPGWSSRLNTLMCLLAGP